MFRRKMLKFVVRFDNLAPSFSRQKSTNPMPGVIMRSPNARALSTASLICLAILLLALPSTTLTQDADVDDETCLDCHEDYDKSLAATPHRLSFQTENLRTELRCVSCHPKSEAHLDDPSEETMASPAELGGRELLDICTQCHKAHDELDNYGYDAHSTEDVNCTECHAVHGYDASLLLDDDAEFCLKCHTATRTQFARRSNHPVLQQNITCLNCHRFTVRQDHTIAYDLSSHCRDCHPEQGGPFLYEHEAVNAYSLEGGTGCSDCHEPHGSANNRLLRQPGNQICAQCHFPAGHRTAHGGIWADRPCQFCHIDTHGSFVSNLYLDPDLPAKVGGVCYNSGCHSLNR
ncbi:MAG: hypothetical protein JSW58_14800 [Candidatus Latescibacterota bacterium]|nr:MAG: hypothetical protein JSW58_14800 [Candidatus Latescibacterota bacterium]